VNIHKPYYTTLNNGIIKVRIGLIIHY